MPLFEDDVWKAASQVFAYGVADLHTGEINYVTWPLEQMFGYKVRGRLLKKSVESLVPNLRRKAHIEHRANYAANPEPKQMGREFELEGQREDGSTFPVEVGLWPMVITDQECVLFQVADMSARNKQGGS